MQVPAPSIDLPALLLQSNGTGAPPLLDAVIVAAIAGISCALIVRFRLWRVPNEPRGRTPLDPVLWMLAATVVYLAGGLGLLASHLSSDEAYSRLAIGVTASIVQVGLAALLMLQLSRTASRAAARLPHALSAGAIAFLLVLPITAAAGLALTELLVSLGEPRPPQTSHETLILVVSRRDPLFTTLTLLHVAVLVPLAEEFLWRGLLQPALRSVIGAWPAIGMTAALFMLVHWTALAPEGRTTGLVMIALLAIGLGVVRERTGSLAAPVAMHALFNAANVAIALLQNPVSSSGS